MAIVGWLGQFHPVLVHFPIALVIMTAMAELLYAWRRNPLYNHAAQFMLVAAAIFAVPTILTGFAFAHGAVFSESMVNYFWWHRLMGITTGIWLFFTTALRFTIMRGPYLVSLTILVVLVTTTATLGGILERGI